MSQFGFHFYQFTVGVRHKEYGCNPVGSFAFECLYFTFAFYDQADSYRLYTSGRESGFYFFPQYRRKFKTYDTIEDTSSLPESMSSSARRCV